MPLKQLTGTFLTLAAVAALAGCSSTTGGTADTSATSTEPFAIASAKVSSMTKANLCRDLGGQGQAPTLTISHTATAGVPIRVSLTDYLSDGSTYNHRSTRVLSDGSGTTTVNYGFLPPCNTTNGRLDSDYRFTVQANGETETVRWGRFDSASNTIR
ncbi:hypothetical protein [Pelagibacterium xiamenense]|uniref:hypothetical protein n=1 Tax=Pelagibacterium xiamenense TaxID=2901140 RepID=UPI001E30E8BC|nr:hypothetical protein [Pelagibacterium xiamenense]MCD7059100.1 hypothetical protein [Pelagibacterium xiamenense]